MSDEVLLATRTSLRQILQAYLDLSSQSDDLYDALADPVVIRARELLDDPDSSWYAVDYKLLRRVMMKAAAYLEDPEKRSGLVAALENLQDHRRTI